VTSQEIVNHQTDNAGLVKDDVIVSFSKINYSMNESNPVDSIRFFSKFNDQGMYRIVSILQSSYHWPIESFNISQEKVSYMIPHKFQDINIRIFARDKNKMSAIQKAFRRYLAQITREEANADPTVPLPLNCSSSKKRRSSSLLADS
jgi:hypothetical protein